MGIAVAIVSAMCFGVYPAAIRAAYSDGGNAVFIIVLTTWVRALTLALYCLLTRKRLFQTRGNILNAVTGGFFQALTIFGIVGGLVFLPGPLVIIIVFSHTLMLLFFLAWRGEIRLDTFIVCTTIAALGGLILVLDVWHKQAEARLIGMGLAFLAAIATVSRLYVYGHQTRDRNPAVVGAENFLVAALFTLLAILFKTPHVPGLLTGYLWAALGSVSLAAGTFGMFYGIALLGSFRWSLYTKSEPVFASIFSALLLGELLNWQQYAGIAIVVGSLAAYQFREQRNKAVAR